MPTFTAIALDRLLDPAGTSKSSSSTSSSSRSSSPITASDDSMLVRRNSYSSLTTTTATVSKTPTTTSSSTTIGSDSKSNTHKKASVPHLKLSRRNSTALTTDNKKEKPSQWPHISPALYAAPVSTPLPDSPASFPPSPYIINHKRRGPRLSKSVSVEVLSQASPPQIAQDECTNDNNNMQLDVGVGSNGDSTGKEIEFEHPVVGDNDVATSDNHVEEVEKDLIGSGNGEIRVGTVGENSGQNIEYKFNSEEDGENEDFFDPRDNMSVTSNTDGEDYYGAERSAKATSPMGEFFDAWEELSTESARQSLCTVADLDTELREIRLSLLMEIEKRTQAEDTLNWFQSQWQILHERLGEAGLVLPAEPTVPAEYSQGVVDCGDEICRQVSIARFVSESIGKGFAKAEFQTELEAHLELKNFEIACLFDRLHYYESMNREMSQRNQEAIEMARRDRRRRRRRQRWVWGSVAAAITLGSAAALAWSYLYSCGKESSPSSRIQASDRADPGD